MNIINHFKNLFAPIDRIIISGEEWLDADSTKTISRKRVPFKREYHLDGSDNQLVTILSKLKPGDTIRYPRKVSSNVIYFLPSALALDMERLENRYIVNKVIKARVLTKTKV